MKRRTFIQSALASSTLPAYSALPAQSDQANNPATEPASILRRVIPSSGEQLPVIGLGTARRFDVSLDEETRAQLGAVLQALVEGGGSLMDTSPMYGRAESVVGELAAPAGVADKLFYATKVWIDGQQAGVEQMQKSMDLMKIEKLDLIQVHNLRDTAVHMETLNQWKAAGRVRYLGLTHYHSGGYADMAAAMRNYDVDFIQINHSINQREVETELYPLAEEQGIAVIVNRAFENGAVFSAVKDKTLPSWAADFDCSSWGQFFLKFVLAHPAVTCIIPGTSKARHMRDNLQAGRGLLPNPDQRAKMIEFMSS